MYHGIVERFAGTDSLVHLLSGASGIGVRARHGLLFEEQTAEAVR